MARIVSNSSNPTPTDVVLNYLFEKYTDEHIDSLQSLKGIVERLGLDVSDIVEFGSHLKNGGYLRKDSHPMGNDYLIAISMFGISYMDRGWIENIIGAILFYFADKSGDGFIPMNEITGITNETILREIRPTLESRGYFEFLATDILNVKLSYEGREYAKLAKGHFKL